MSQKKPTSAAKKSKISKTVENVTAEIAPSESETNRKDSVANNNENSVKISKGQRKLNGNAAVTDVSKNTRTNSSKGSSLYQTKALAGVLSRFPVVFTKDSKYFFCCVSNTIKIYNVSSGEVVKTLSTSVAQGGHRLTVTALSLNPKNPLQLFSASLDGTIKLWDYNDNILLKTHQLNLPIENMIISPHHPEHAYILTKKLDSATDEQSQQSKTKNNAAVYRYVLQGQSPQRLFNIIKTRDCSTIAISADGNFLAIGARYKVHIWDLRESIDSLKAGIRTYTSPEIVTCIEFSPTEPCLAVGDESGKITQYYCFTPETAENPVTALLHWHHRPVNTLTFTADGVYLLSGGEEPVLVLWQLETGHKQFLPRVGGEIKSITISPNQSLYALSQADNSIRIINAVSQQIVRIIQGLQYAQAASNTYPLYTGLVIEPRNHHVVLNGVPGSIQFYNPYLDSHVLDLEIVPMTRISRADENELVHSLVRHVAFMDDGSWMATVDSRDDKITTPELYLKFWAWDPNSQSYILKTRVDYPHSAAITSLSFRRGTNDDLPMAITTSEDKKFKIWHLTSELGRHHTSDETAWTCRAVGFYRENIPTAANFSDDGSMLAVAFGQVLTIWDPSSNTIQGTLTLPPQQCHIHKVAFLGNTPFIAVTTATHLYVWNLLTCTVWWSYNIQIDQLSVDQQTGVFAVACNAHNQQASECRFIVFEPATPVPKFVHAVAETCKALAWIPVEHDEANATALTSNLVYLNHNYDMQVLHAAQEDQDNEGESDKAATSLATQGMERSLFTDIFGKRNKSNEDRRWDQQRIETAEVMRKEAATASRSHVATRSRRNAQQTSVLDAPSHIIPGVDNVFESFMDSIMPKRSASDEQEINGEDMEEEETSFSHDESETDATEEVVMTDALTNGKIEQEVDLPPAFNSMRDFFAKTSELSINGKVNGTKAAVEDSSSDDDSSDEEAADIEW